jgi:sugar/nucleoside kinase (ribokinase family)
MSILVVGSVAYDTIKTPADSRADALGGSATFFSIAASYFAPVSLVAVVGDDFLDEHVGLIESHGVDTSGLDRVAGETFRWSGVYSSDDVNSRETLDTRLNVFADFSPILSTEQRDKPYLFLANIVPGLQSGVLAQMAERPRLVALDTMKLWIDGSREALAKAVATVDVVFMDEGEARSFSGEHSLRAAADRILAMGPTTVVVKRGEHGALVFRREMIFAAPAFPLDHVVDPTGAGDSFAGGFLGYLASTGDLSDEGFRRAAMVGSTMGSFAVESFSVDRLNGLTPRKIEERFRAIEEMTRFEPLGRRESLPWREFAAAV